MDLQILQPRECFCTALKLKHRKIGKSQLRRIFWATAQQNQETVLCIQQRLRSAQASTQSDQSLYYALKG